MWVREEGLNVLERIWGRGRGGKRRGRNIEGMGRMINGLDWRVEVVWGRKELDRRLCEDYFM